MVLRMGEAPEFRRELSNTEPHALVLGSQVFVQGMSAGGRLFVFTRHQMQFLLALQKLKNPEAAAISIGKDEDWAHKFLGSRKLKTYVDEKMEQYSIRNGMTVEWWYQFGKWLTQGYKTHWEGMCHYCGNNNEYSDYKAESFRDESMEMHAECNYCFKEITIASVKEDFKPSREQVEGWKEVGSRLLPKVERVHHEFSKEEFVFESGTGG